MAVECPGVAVQGLGLLSPPPLAPRLPGGGPEAASSGEVAFRAVAQRPGKAFQPAGEHVTSLAEATHLALSQERWDDFPRWQGKDMGERGIPSRNPASTAVCQSNPTQHWNWLLQKLPFQC